MRILVTGGSGFIGHHFVEHLLFKTKYEIVVLDSINYAGDLERLKNVRNKIKFFHHDLRAPIVDSKAERLGQFDFIVHFAAESHVDNSLKNPLLFAESNVIGTVNLLEFARNYQKNLKLYVQVSTDEVYGPARENQNYKEWNRVKPSNPYSASKSAADSFAISYAISYKMPIVVTRTMNNFGERQHPEKFIPMTIKKVLNNEKILIHAQNLGKDIWKSGTRFWLHARNHADGILFLMKKSLECSLKYPDIFHIAGKELSNLQIAQLIADFAEKPLHFEFFDFHSSRPGHDLRYSLDDTKIRIYGWKPPVSFYESLKRTVEWSIKHFEWLK